MMPRQDGAKYGKWIAGAAAILFAWVGCGLYGQVAESMRPVPHKTVAPPALIPITAPYAEPVVSKLQGPDYTPPPAPPTTDEGSGGYATYSSTRRAASGPKTVYVHGYTKKDGTYVSGHTRRAPRR